MMPLLPLIVLLPGCASGPRTLQEQLGYKKDAILVIVHIDDMGMHKDGTDGALAALGFGLAKTGSAMVPAPDFGRLAGVWKSDPALDIGIHATLTSEWDTYRWPPVLTKTDVPSLLDPEGFFWKRENLFKQHADYKEAAREITAQVEKVIGMGLKPTHLDAHMSSYFLDGSLWNTAVGLAKKYNLVLPFIPPPYKTRLTGQGFVSADTFDGFYTINGEEHAPELRRQAYFDWMKSLKPGVHYLYTHIANVTKDLAKIIEMPYIRSGDMDVWTSPETEEYARRLGITFIGMRGLQALQARNFGLRS